MCFVVGRGDSTLMHRLPVDGVGVDEKRREVRKQAGCEDVVRSDGVCT